MKPTFGLLKICLFFLVAPFIFTLSQAQSNDALASGEQEIYLPLVTNEASPSASGELNPEDHGDEYWATLTENEPPFELNDDMRNTTMLTVDQGGQWGSVITWPHTPVSIANLPDGRILTWSGSQPEHWPTTEQTFSAIFDPATETFENYFNDNHNMFCADLVSLDDGRIMAMGGRNTVDKVSIFDPETNSWVQESPMHSNRWYPTATTLGDGGVFIAAGRANRYPERWDEGYGWTQLTGADIQGPILNYGANKDGAGWWPLMHLDPRGNIFHYGATPQMHSIDPTGSGSITNLGPNNFSWFPEEATAIMYDEGKILVSGGAINNATNTSSDKTAVIDINTTTPVVTEIAPMNFARQFSNEVVLPTGEVLVIGGNTTGAKFSDSGTVLEPELWDPATQTWTVLNAMSVPRNYHSTGLLLVDGRVLAAGGGYASGNPDHPATHTDGQIFSPPYLFQANGSPAPRPQISSAPTTVAAGQTFEVQSPDNITRFTMIRSSATTHTMNTGQRFLELPFIPRSGNRYDLTAHSNINVIVPGYWMLFAIDANGVPSEGRMIHVLASTDPDVTNPGRQTNARNDSVSLQIDATVVDGSSPTYSATGLPNGLSINTATGLISGTPTQANTFNVTVTVTDGSGNSSAVSFDWVIFPEGQGQIVREWWTGISGTSVSLLTSNPNYPDNPTGSELIDSFEGPVNWANNYGSRIYGFLYPPVTGNYTFWLSSDDNGQLWLSSDHQPENAVQIARVPSWSSSREWDKFPEQQSASIFLEAGKKYYIEALMKENSGGDNLAVGWQAPGDTAISVIDGAYLSPYSEEPLSLQPIVSAPAETGTAVSYTASFTGGGTPQFKWIFGDGTPETAYSSSPSINHTFAQPGRYLVTLTALDNGQESSIQFHQSIYNTPTANQPNSSSRIVYESRTGSDRIWNVNPDNDTVTVINAVNHNKVAEIPVGDEPNSLGLAPNGRIWVINTLDASISIIDTSSLSVVLTIFLPIGSEPYGVAFSPDGSDAYIALEATGRLLQFNATTAAQTGQLDVGTHVRELAVNADSDRIYVSRFVTPPLPGENTGNPQTNGVGGEVVVVNANNMSVVKTLLLRVDTGSDFEAGARGVPNYVSAPAIAPDGLSAWVPSKEDNILRGTLRDGQNLNFEHTVRAIASYINMNNETEQFNHRLDLDNASVSSAAAYDPNGNFLFVALETSREVSVVDAYGRSELFRINVGRAPQGVVVSDDGSKLFVYNFMDRSVSVYSIDALVNEGTLSAPTLATVNTVANEALSNQVFTGKQLFYDAADDRLAMDNYMSCASCHNGGGQDGRVWDLTGMGEGLRNTISLEGHGNQGPLHWTGNFDEVQDFEGQIRTLAGGTGLLTNNQFNNTSDPLGAPKAGLNSDLDALAAYVNSLSAFDQSPYRDADGTLTNAGETGKQIFTQQNCAACHSGDAFTDSALNTLHDVGTISQPGSGDRLGANLTGFDSPTLRGLWLTAPYLHDGSAATLADAVNAHSGVNLSNAELNSLISYLNQIDDREPAAVGNVAPVLTNPGNQANTVGDSITLQLSASDGDGDTLTYSATGLPNGLSLNSGNGRITGTPTTAQTTTVNVTVSDGSLSDTESFSWTISEANVAPVLTNPGNQTSTVGDSVTLQLAASDGNGDALTYSATGLPTGLSLNSGNGRITGTPTTAQTTTVNVTVSDGSLSDTESFSWTISEANVAPVLTNPGNQTSTVGDSVTLQLSASDGNGDALTYSATALPNGLSLNVNNGRITGAPTTAQTTTVNVTVSDGSLSDSASFTWVIEDVPAPQANIYYYSFTGNGSVGGVGFADEDIVAYDVDNGTWSLYFDGSDVGLGVSGNADTDAIHVRADGSILLSIRATETLPDVGTINNTDIVLFTPTSTGTTTAGSFSMYFDGSDVELTGGGEDITAVYEMANGDLILSTVGSVFVSSIGTTMRDEDLIRFSGSYGDNTSGSYTVYFDGSDADMTASTEEFFGLAIDEATGDIRMAMRGGYDLGGVIGDANDIILCTSPSLGENSSCTYQLLLDGDPLGLNNRFIDGLSITGDSGGNGNTPPQIDNPGDQLNETGDAVSLQIVASDANGDSLSYSATGLPAGLSINTNSGLISGSSTAVGTTAVTVSVNDGTVSRSVSFDWTITAVNAAPSVTNPGAQSSSEGDAVGLQINASDANGDTLSYSATGLPANLTINSATGAISGLLTYESAGSYSVTVTVSDGIDTDSASFTWTVADAEPPAGSDIIYLSFTGNGGVDNVSFADEDIIAYDTVTGQWSLYFDGSDVGLAASGNHDTDAFHVRADGSILLSVRATATLPDVGEITNADIVLFTPTSLGDNTAGTFSMYFDGSDVGLTNGGEDITAVYETNSGDLIISTVGTNNVGTLGNSGDEDLLRFSGTFGENTSGTWSLYFDGSDAELTDSTEEIFGVSLNEATGDIQMIMRGAFSVTGAAGSSDDILGCNAAVTGANSSCSYAMYQTGAALGIDGRAIDGLSIVRP